MAGVAKASVADRTGEGPAAFFGRRFRCLVFRANRKARDSVNDFLVRGLAEVGVIEADRAKELVIFQVDNMVGLFAHGSKGVGWCDRYGENELARLTHARGAERRAGGRANGNAVVNDNGDTARDIDSGAATLILFAMFGVIAAGLARLLLAPAVR